MSNADAIAERVSGRMRAVSAQQPEPENAAADDEVDDTSGGWSATRLSRPRRLLFLVFGVAVVLLVLDVVTKVAAVAGLEGRSPVRLLGGTVYLVLFRNPGAAFSLATGLTWLLALLAVVVVIAIVWIAPKLRSVGWAIGLGAVLAGTCGNLVDRLFRAPGPLQGHVVDFISLFAPDGSVWPVFNVADSSIVCGGILVVLMSVLGRDYDGTVHRKSGSRKARDRKARDRKASERETGGSVGTSGGARGE